MTLLPLPSRGELDTAFAFAAFSEHVLLLFCSKEKELKDSNFIRKVSYIGILLQMTKPIIFVITVRTRILIK
jgi:hypothetical protein